MFMDTRNDMTLDNLYLALIQCFAVIMCGYVQFKEWNYLLNNSLLTQDVYNLVFYFRYIAGRTHMIMQRETSGLNTFVGKFSLPSLIFISLCQLDLSSVNWMFILAIFISKIIIFFVVVIITVVVTRPTNIARAGLLAIFCTQTNDFAIGVPIGKCILHCYFNISRCQVI